MKWIVTATAVCGIAPGRYLTIWRREGGEWWIIRFMLNAPQ